jgi:hypothetical protein
MNLRTIDPNTKYDLRSAVSLRNGITLYEAFLAWSRKGCEIAKDTSNRTPEVRRRIVQRCFRKAKNCFHVRMMPEV